VFMLLSWFGNWCDQNISNMLISNVEGVFDIRSRIVKAVKESDFSRCGFEIVQLGCLCFV